MYGKILGDGVDAILGCGVILKNAVGMVGVIIIIGICILPIIKLGTFSIMYSLASCILPILKLSVLTISYQLVASVGGVIADEKIVKLLGEMSGVFKLLLAVLTSVSVLLIIGITLVVKISNSGMMYR